MVDESLIAYLLNELSHSTKAEAEDSELKLRLLFYYTDEDHLFKPEEVDKLINAIDNLKVIDPACGSGAFLMGLLLKIVYILHKLDPQNTKWKQQQIANINNLIEETKHTITDAKIRDESIQKLRNSIQDIKETFDQFDFDYSRKLFLIEHCIYGSDIQPIAIQIAKLRFFISLLVDQYTKEGKPNLGIRALPNLETNLVTANSLIQLELPDQMELFDTFIEKFITDIKAIHNEYFSTRNRKDKLELKKKEHNLRVEFSKELKNLNFPHQQADYIANWDPYSLNSIAPFFNPTVMFGVPYFNIVISNPPYIRQENIPYKDLLRESGYQIFNSTSDIYTYFYELAYKLLSEKGIATYITSNKWLRSKYGAKLRQFLKQNTKLQILIDFGGYQVFKSSTVDTNIIVFSKEKPDPNHSFSFVNMPANLTRESLSTYILDNKQTLQQNILQDNCWTLTDNTILNLKNKIEKAGKPLKSWDVKIYRGIVTGCNEAFIIDTPTKEIICKADSKSEEIINPLLRGRDIHKYYYEWAGLWIIATFPALNLDIDKYPAVKNYLSSFGKKLEQNGGNGCRSKNNNEWFEIQANIAYYKEFNKDKIIWADISQDGSFTYDSDHFYITNTAYMLLGKNLFYLLGVLNSKIFDFYFDMISAHLSDKAKRYFTIYIEQFPVPEFQNSEKSMGLEKLVSEFLSLMNNRSISDNKNASSDISDYLNRIDSLVYKLYGLNEDDIKIINKALEK